MKSLNRFTPLVRTRRSSGGFPAVYKCSAMVEAVIDSGSGYTSALSLSLESFGGESGCRVVVDETESSTSDVLDGVGEVPRGEDDEVEV